MDTGSSAAANAVFVQSGTTQSDSGWVCTADSPNDIVGTNNLPFVQFNGAENIIAGSGISKSGNTLSVDNTVVRTSGVQTISGNKTFNSPTTVSLITDGTATLSAGALSGATTLLLLELLLVEVLLTEQLQP